MAATCDQGQWAPAPTGTPAPGAPGAPGAHCKALQRGTVSLLQAPSWAPLWPPTGRCQLLKLKCRHKLIENTSDKHEACRSRFFRVPYMYCVLCTPWRRPEFVLMPLFLRGHRNGTIFQYRLQESLKDNYGTPALEFARMIKNPLQREHEFNA